MTELCHWSAERLAAAVVGLVILAIGFGYLSGLPAAAQAVSLAQAILRSETGMLRRRSLSGIAWPG